MSEIPAATGAAADDRPEQRKGVTFGRLFRTYGTFAIFVLLVLLASTQSDAFLTERNATNLLRQMSGVGIMAIGMLFVILTRGIDLSVGSIAALGAVTSALFVQEMSMPLAILSVVAVGAACGAISVVLDRLSQSVGLHQSKLAMMTGAAGRFRADSCSTASR